MMRPIRQHLRWARDPRSPLAMVECRLAKLLAYWAVPGTVVLFWLRYLVMQDYRGTLLQVFLLTLVAAAGCWIAPAGGGGLGAGGGWGEWHARVFRVMCWV